MVLGAARPRAVPLLLRLPLAPPSKVQVGTVWDWLLALHSKLHADSHGCSCNFGTFPFWLDVPVAAAGGLFGASAPAATQQPAGQFAFGSAAHTNAQSAAAPAFGGGLPSFGAASAPAFGAGISAPAFGAGSAPAPAFGAAPSSAPAFDTTSGAAHGFGAMPAFGAQSAPAFGATLAPAFGGASGPALGTGFAFGGLYSPSTKSLAPNLYHGSRVPQGDTICVHRPLTLTLQTFLLTNSHNVRQDVYKIVSPVAGGASQAQTPFGGMHSQPAFGQSSVVPTFGAQQAGQPANPFGQPGVAAFGQPEQPQPGAGNGGTPSCLGASSSPCMLSVSGSVCSLSQLFKTPVQQPSMKCLFLLGDWKDSRLRSPFVAH